MLTNVILTIVLVLIAGSAAFYLYRAKKRGEHCVGCPYAKQCVSKNCNCNSSNDNIPKQ